MSENLTEGLTVVQNGPNPSVERERFPVWMRRSLSQNTAFKTHRVLGRYPLHTVCESALCPNQNECYGHGTATFMILGGVCTRRCEFCAVETGKPSAVSAEEPDQIAQAAAEMGLRYVVITSVTRDDLCDEGAGQFAKTIRALRKTLDGVRVEVLTPDFHGRPELIAEVVHARPDIYNHNVETVGRLQHSIRPQASYERSLAVLETVKKLSPEMVTKSGIMLGLGETIEEVYQVASDLRSVGCDLLTVGQYLQPTERHVKVSEYVRPEVFNTLAADFKALGFRDVFSGPYVRSSYHAGEVFSNSHY